MPDYFRQTKAVSCSSWIIINFIIFNITLLMLIILDLWKVLKCGHHTFISIVFVMPLHPVKRLSVFWPLYDSVSPFVVTNLHFNMPHSCCQDFCNDGDHKHSKLCSFVRIISFYVVKHCIVANSSISNTVCSMFTVSLSHSFADNISLY